MRTKAVRVLLLVIAAYVLSYVIAFARREPAANLAYFCYARPSASESVERTIYRFYWPVYKLHRLLGAQRHNYDRPEPVDNPLG